MDMHELASLVSRSLFADLGYVDAAGRPAVRRVFCTWHKGLTGHLISTNTSSGHVQALLRRKEACLYFADSETFEGVCLTGHALVHQENKWKELLWHDGDEKYYPLGVQDPDYCVIEFIAEEAAYYRFDGKGRLSRQEMDAFFPEARYEDGYARTHQEDEA